MTNDLTSVETWNYDAAVLLTAKVGSEDFIEPSVLLSLANMEAAIRARAEYIKSLPDNVFDELTR